MESPPKRWGFHLLWAPPTSPGTVGSASRDCRAHGTIAATAVPPTAAAAGAEQILAAARDFAPIYYERYMIDKHNKSPEVQQGAVDSAHYFYSLSPEDRRAYSEQMVTNFADPMTAAWPNWAKIFFNNKGVAATETDHCADDPPDDQSVWDWSPAR
jgi:hypothetical protein